MTTSQPMQPAAEASRVSRQSGREIITSRLQSLRRISGVTGTLLATIDGRGLISDLEEETPGAAAAVTASAMALAARLGDLTSPGAAVQELQVRSEAGYVCLYVINPQVVLAIITDETVNLGQVRLDVRSVSEEIRRVLAALAAT